MTSQVKTRTGRSYWDLFQPGHLYRELNSSQVITFCPGCFSVSSLLLRSRLVEWFILFYFIAGVGAWACFTASLLLHVGFL